MPASLIATAAEVFGLKPEELSERFERKIPLSLPQGKTAYEIEGVRFEKRVLMPHLQNTTHVSYTLLAGDPVLESMIESREDLTDIVERFKNLLLGGGHGPAGRVIISMITNGVYSAVTDKELEDVSDEQLHKTLLAAAQQLLRTPSYFE